jgi:hypothetical protein
MKKKLGGGRKGKKKHQLGIGTIILTCFVLFFVFENNAKHMDYDVLLGFLELPKL